MLKRWFLILLPLLLVGCSSDESVVQPSPLPQFKPQIQVQKLWTATIGNGVGELYLNLEPAVTERWVYAASASGLLYKLDRETGERQWQKNLPLRITGGVAAGYGMVAVGSANGELVVLDAEDGSELWRKSLGGQILSAPALGGNRVVVQTIDGRLRGLQREDGATVWLFDTSIPVLTLRGEASPVVKGPVTLAGFANGKLVALDTDSGYVAWERLIGEPSGRSELERLIDLDGRFWVSDKVVYAVTFQGALAAIDVPTGRLLWSKPLSSYSGVSEFLSRLYVVDEDSVLYAKDAVSGTDIWQQDKLKGRGLSAPTAYDRYVLVGDYEGFLYWLSYRDGAFLARAKVGVKRFQLANPKAQSLRRLTHPAEGIRVEPVVYDDTVYVQGNSGELAAYRVIETQ
ncbi:MAG: outer membrane protein assembly factor BamB [Pseudomonadales bacterium]|nr:outer membrane protein assembly factor BamB [Pseudomonadales bacterium]